MLFICEPCLAVQVRQFCFVYLIHLFVIEGDRVSRDPKRSGNTSEPREAVCVRGCSFVRILIIHRRR